jgi:hypothetical protein
MKYSILACIGLFAVAAYSKPCNITALSDFVAGTYTLIGREPDAGKAYSGTVAVKALPDKTILLTETVRSHPPRIWRGQFRTAEPGEGCVLALESKHGSMACLASPDLDNYARMTCLWNKRKKRHTTTGLMALFPTS